MYLLKLKPVCKDFLWGGTRLKKEYSKESEEETLAESWEFSFHKSGLSRVENGIFAGKTLLDIFNSNPEFFGQAKRFGDGIPLLVKLIDANQKLSIQVHPTDEYAKKNENQNNGKTEMWYVLDAKEDSKLIYGFEYDMTPDRIRQSLKDGSFEKNLHFEKVKSGDVFYIPAGTVHAICEGVLLVEIQQSSDLTYRFYDYDRVDKNGNKRQLHVDKAIDVVNMKANVLKNINTKLIDFRPNVAIEELCNNKYFRVKKFTLKGLFKIDVSSDDFNIFLCTKGSGIIMSKQSCLLFKKGDTILATNSQETIKISGDCEILKINC